MNILNIINRFKKAAEPNAMVLADLAELQKRNAKRMAAIKESMGDKYILAECHKKTRLTEPRPV